MESRTLPDASANAVFLAQAYRDLLHREADAGGLSFFSAALDLGANRIKVALAIQNSVEYRTSQIQTLYGSLLRRPADLGGMAAFTAAFSAGATLEQAEAIILGSTEYFQTRAGGNADNFLQSLYQDVFQRSVDSSGQATFSQQLSSGVGRTQVAQAILSSPEYFQNLVQSFYQQYLHRTADSAGLSGFVSALKSGTRDEQVVAIILASPEYAPPDPPPVDSSVMLSAGEVQRLLERAAAASASNDAIIAVVDRGGRVRGVRVEAGVASNIKTDPALLTFAVDGALAEARTGAFFANDQAPLTSRTVRFISQTTMTQREVESNPNIPDPNSPLRGPGFVAPIGIAGHFPPNVPFTPQVDLFAIEHTNRDSIIHPGPDGIRGTPDDIRLPNRFNVADANIPMTIPANQRLQPPESYGLVSGLFPNGQSRGIGTLPGGIPIYGQPDANGISHVVGGVGVFFPGTTGFATEENSSLDAKYDPRRRDRSLEAEFMAFTAVGDRLPKNLGNPIRLDLVGITLDTIGPGGTRGIDTLLQFGRTLGTRAPVGDTDLPVDLLGDTYLNGSIVPDGWLVTPHDGQGITSADVIRIVSQGIAQANRTRAAIRLPLGSRTRMVFSVTDRTGEVLGLYRMPDATVFSLDVAVAKARNVTYYADASMLQASDQVPGVPPGTALSNRTFRFLALPHFPEGIDAAPPGPFSILNDGGVDPRTGLNVGPPLPASAFRSLQGFDAFHPSTNFHDLVNFANQNGIVFFPGATPLYKDLSGTGRPVLVGGLGVSGDGVDQDDGVTAAGAAGYLPPPTVLRADQVTVRGVRLPFIKLNRNPEG